MNHPLLARTTITDYLLRDAVWAESHGATGDHLGSGLLYYTLVYTLKARVAVCLGSGGGFVPRLMRQAQRDLGMADRSRTILVDANLPEVNWGAPVWLAQDSFFRTQYPDVELVIDLTRNAARGFFAEQGISIDYLHIDADHSFAGCYEDFTTFRQFLHEGSIVTLHDTNYPGAGVAHVVEHIRTLADCEVLDMPDIGVGLAVVRIGKTDGSGRSRSLPAATTANSALIGVTRTQAMPPIPPPVKEWGYLESRAFATRYVLAAHFLRQCRSVIEIGGAKTPIDLFLTGDHDAILVIDPLISESHQTTWHGRSCTVSHVRARFQDLAWTIPPQADYGLVMLGMEFQGLTPEHWETLLQLIHRARVTVIEFPMSWAPSAAQFELIRAHASARITFQAKLDLDGNDFGDLANSWPPRVDRTLYVLEPWPSLETEQHPAPDVSQAEPSEQARSAQALLPEAAADSQHADMPDLPARLTAAWQSACASDSQAQATWRSDGGLWQWRTDGAVASTSGVEWSNLEWQPWKGADVRGLRNVVIDATVSGKAEAAGLSFGSYKDFLARFDHGQETHHLQLEIDADAGSWAFRVDGQLQNRCWWDAAAHSPDDLLSGVLTLKARRAQEIRFERLTLSRLESSARLSVIITCYRFAQRLRVTLRNWCHASLPQGALEVLVVNPHSPDGTHEHLAAVAGSYPQLRVRELDVPDDIARNKGAMINRAVAASRGEWIWLTDADCLFASDSAAAVLRHVDGRSDGLFYGERRYLTAAQTDALLAGRLDPLHDFAELAATTGTRPPENAPWGYTQIAHRSIFERLRYSERLNHFAHSDGMFVEECRRQGIAVEQIPGLFCLHLDHPFAWYGAKSFL